MYSEVSGELREKISLEEIFKALFPSGSITGCPKIRSQEAITNLENTERGVYTGSIGYLSHEEANLSVAIRTMHSYKEYLYYQVGGGIVWDSEAESEWQECRTKAQMFLQKET
jgi:anthranilate/para-aminobenzoate synthase component I